MRANSVTLAVVLLGSMITVAAAAAAGTKSADAFDPPSTGTIPDPSVLRPTFGEPVARQAPPRAPENARAAPSWCEHGRIVGSGLGFCEIN